MLIDHYVDMYVCMLTLRIMLLTVGKIKESIPKSVSIINPKSYPIVANSRNTRTHLPSTMLNVFGAYLH